MPNIVADYESLTMQLAQKQNVTSYGEPQAFIGLPRGRSLEVVHEQYGLPENEQYYSFRVHCSDEEFDLNAYHGTMGTVEQTTSTDMSKDVCMKFLRWAYAVAEKC